MITSAGLVLDIIGVIILAKTGLPSKGIRNTGYVQSFDLEKVKTYDRWSAFALGSIVTGFVLQIIEASPAPPAGNGGSKVCTVAAG